MSANHWDLHHAALTWSNEPPKWSRSPQQDLSLEMAGETDAWQRTHYGFCVDNPHFLFLPDLVGDFVLSTSVRFHHVNRYDQAGLMVRLSPHCWIKTSVEHDPPHARLGVVVTNSGYSDWSTTNFPLDLCEVDHRIRREGTDYIIEARYQGSDGWQQIRMAHLLEDQPGKGIAAGVYACAPKGTGGSAVFRNTCLTPGTLQQPHSAE